jgi:hypothetical protein
VSTPDWARPPALADLARQLVPDGGAEARSWPDLVARAVAADTLSRVHDDLGDLDATDVDAHEPDSVTNPVDDLVTDFLGIWAGLAAGEGREAEDAAAELTADLVAHFEHLTTAQLQGLTDTVHDTAVELHARELLEAGELDDPEPPVEDDETSTATTRPGSDLAVLASPLSHAATSKLTAVTSDLGIDPLGLTSQARSIAGSLVPDGLGQLVPEAAVVSLAASAGMRIRQGEPVSEVREWLVGELSTMGVANAASVAIQLLSGLVVLRPLAVLGAKWGRARAQSSAQAAVAVRAARARLAPLVSA